MCGYQVMTPTHTIPKLLFLQCSINASVWQMKNFQTKSFLTNRCISSRVTLTVVSLHLASPLCVATTGATGGASHEISKESVAIYMQPTVQRHVDYSVCVTYKTLRPKASVNAPITSSCRSWSSLLLHLVVWRSQTLASTGRVRCLAYILYQFVIPSGFMNLNSTTIGLGSNYRKWCSTSNRLFGNLIGTALRVAAEQILI